MGDALVFFLWPIEWLALYSGETRAARPWNKRFSCGPLLSLPLSSPTGRVLPALPEPSESWLLLGL